MYRKIFFALLLLPVLSFAGMSRGERLEKQLWKYVKHNDMPSVKRHISKQFQSINSLQLFGPATMYSVLNRFLQIRAFEERGYAYYQFSHMKVTEGEKIIVVSYKAIARSIAAPKLKEDFYIEVPVKAISTWKKIGHTWKWVGHVVIPIKEFQDEQA